MENGMQQTKIQYITKQSTMKESLTKVLQDATFREVKEWDWKSVFTSIDYDDHSQAYFPHMDKSDGIHVSLNLECIK